jgi:divalent metal cation (Fe/Co/Zn/Cd) transporter
MAAQWRVTPDERAKERSILRASIADATILVGLVSVGVLGGSLTMTAEAVRGGLMLTIEAFSLLVLRRIHRGMLTDLEFGTGKLEQVANLAIAGGLLGGAVWIAAGAVAMATGQRLPGMPFGLALAAVTGAVNAYINLWAWVGMRDAGATGSSLIMQAQLNSRTVKLVSSLFVQLTMTVAAISTDDVVAIWADAVGSLFVVGFIVVNAIRMLRAGFPDLIDRAVEEEVQLAINRALAQHFDDYDRFDGVRSRRSSERVFVEVALGFDGRLTMTEVDRRIAALTATIEREIAHADVTVLVSSHETPAKTA